LLKKVGYFKFDWHNSDYSTFPKLFSNVGWRMAASRAPSSDAYNQRLQERDDARAKLTAARKALEQIEESLDGVEALHDESYNEQCTCGTDPEGVCLHCNKATEANRKVWFAQDKAREALATSVAQANEAQRQASEIVSLRARLAEAELDSLLMARWIFSHRGEYGLDHACKRCFPDGDILIKGFVCAYHKAEDILAAAKAASHKERNEHR